MAVCFDCHREVFKYIVEDGKNVCRECHPSHVYHRGQIFPFVTTNLLPGQRVEVNSLFHLRQIERAHNVQFAAFSLDEKHMNAEDAGQAMERSHPHEFRRLDTRGWERTMRGER